MDEALGLADYLPVSFKTASDQEYISFLWETFESNYDNGKYQFAFLAYHMLMMSFVYCNIWQIKRIWNNEFLKGTIGFSSREEKSLLKASSPLDFSRVSESSVLRLLRLIGCDSSQIGQCLALVGARNEAAHANGHIFLATQLQLDTQVRQVLRVIEGIQTHSHPIIDQCYQEFLLQRFNTEEPEYLDAEDQIREVLIHGNYMSRKDIDFCVNFDISAVETDNKEAIEALHNALCETYGSA